MLLNFGAGLIGGIWLAYLGYWYLLLLGLGLTIGGTFLVSLLLMPSLILIAPVAASEKLSASTMLMIPLTVISVGYTYCVMGAWTIGIFWYFAHEVSSNAIIPVVLWSYSAATAAWSYMAQKEAQTGNDYSTMSAFFNQIGCIALIVYVYTHFGDLRLYDMGVWFAVPMIISLALQLTMMVSIMKAQQSR